MRSRRPVIWHSSVLALASALACTRASAPEQGAASTVAPAPASPRAATQAASPDAVLRALSADNYYRVHDVQPHDTLNVRQQPGAAEAVVATLGPNAGGVLWMGTSGKLGTASWWRVAAAGKNGWVNAAFLTRAPAPADTPVKLVCFGNEPFWALTIMPDGRSTCEAMCEGPSGLRALIEPQADARFLVTVTRADGARFLSGTVARSGSCSDGMSDFTHLWAAHLERASGPAFDGCCRIEP